MRFFQPPHALKKAGIFALCLVLFFPFAFPSYADIPWTKKGEGIYRMIDGTEITGVYARGIDVSHWQGEIDWKKVAEDDVDFVMFGTRYKGDVDPRFRYNVSEAAKNKLDIGIYLYGYAMTVEEAEAEADFVLELIKDYPVSYPVAYDVEDTNTQGTLPKEELTKLILAFTKKIEEAGYYPMLYANDYWIANKLDMKALSHLDVWVARYHAKHVYKTPSMWQATSTGSIAGIKGNVDIDFQYKDYSQIIPRNTRRMIAGKEYFYKDFQMQKDTWVQDPTGYYYVDEGGQPKKGWLTEGKLKYFLEETSGRMVTGWKQFDKDWSFFKQSGALATGWINDAGTWYYSDASGKMQTGWLELSGKKYYLTKSGAMATGFVDIAPDQGQAQNRYYFSPDGEMKTAWQNIDNAWYYFHPRGHLIKGWIKDGDRWYYADENGMMKTGLLELGGVRYYLAEDGHMLADTQITLSDVLYQVDANGALSPAPTPPETDPSLPSPETGAGPDSQTQIGKEPSPGNNNGVSHMAPQ